MSTPEGSITLHPPSASRAYTTSDDNPLPQLLQTPSGLALLELQGTINFPEEGSREEVQIGRLEFPDYDPLSGNDANKWMNRVWMWVGRYQRLHGEVKKLPQAVAIVRRRGEVKEGDDDDEAKVEELEVVEIVKYKIVFGQRPEPVTGGQGEQQQQGTEMDLDG
ncbi:Ctf8-domain-containing protein [Cladorrhinum sp. PSN259]|nr:Ctf8-domain-containing protein [Cladorrhinum sp. PSN259]